MSNIPCQAHSPTPYYFPDLCHAISPPVLSYAHLFKWETAFTKLTDDIKPIARLGLDPFAVDVGLVAEELWVLELELLLSVAAVLADRTSLCECVGVTKEGVRGGGGGTCNVGDSHGCCRRRRRRLLFWLRLIA